MTSISEVRALDEERLNIHTAMTDLKAEIGTDEPTAEQRAQIERLADSYVATQSRVTDMLGDIERENESNELRARIERAGSVEKTEAGSFANVQKALVDLYEGERRSLEFGPDANRADFSYEARDAVTLTAGTATDGAELVPTDLHGRLVEYLVDYSGGVLEAGAFVLNTAGGNQINVPRLVSESDMTAEDETDTIATSNPQFDTVPLNAYKAGALMPVTRELIEDSAFAVSQVLVNQAGRSMGGFIGTQLVTGSGSGETQGVDNATSGITLGSGTEITHDEVVDILFSVARPYRRNGSFIVDDTVVKALMKVQATDGDATPLNVSAPLWQPSLQAGVPDRILGRPVYVDNAFAALSDSSGVCGVYGDINAAYWVRFAGNLRIDRSDEFGFDTDTVYFRAVQRFDGAIVDGNAVRAITTAA